MKMLNNKMYLSLSIVSVFVITLVPLSTAQVPFPRQCPNVTLMDTFNVDAYMGVWYEYTKYPFAFEIGKKCMYATYENIGNDTVSVVNSAINRFTNRPSNVTGKAKIQGPGQLTVVFSRNQRADKPNYIVLGTDYDSYAVVYSCSNFTPIAHIKIVWVLTRERQPQPETIAKAKQILTDNNISLTFLIDTKQNGCPDPNDTTNVESWTESEGNIETETNEFNDFPSELPNRIMKL